MNMKTKKQTQQDLALIWFDWKHVSAVLEGIDQLTERGPLCFRLIEPDEEDEQRGYVDDNYYVVVSEQPIPKAAAKAFYKQEMARMDGEQAAT